MLLLLFAVSGTVVDRDGKTVAGAVVIAQAGRARVEAKTDDEGRWTLDAPKGETAFLFASKDGFRFHGQRLAAGKIVLVRRSEKPGKEMRTLPPLLPLDKRQELATKVMKDEFDAALKNDKEDRFRLLAVMARIDPARAIEVLEKKPLDPWFDGYVRREAVKQLAEGDMEEARAFAEAVKDPGFRCCCLLDLFDALPEGKKTERKKLLEAGLVSSKSAKENDKRVIYLAWVARRYLALGDKTKAAAIFKEGHAIAKELPTAGWAGYARAAFAVNLGLIDKEGALDLLKGLKDPLEIARHNSNLAERIAALDPESAETRLRAGYKDGLKGMEHQAAPICARMVTTDPKRARKLADEVGGKGKALVLAAMAQGLGKSEKALPLLDEAFALLKPGDAASALFLVPIVERIDPALVPEFFWRGVSLDKAEHTHDRHALAVAAGRYDREMGRAFLARAGDATGDDYYGSKAALLAAAILEPEKAAAMLGKMKDRNAASLREELAKALMETPATAARTHRGYQWWGPIQHDQED